MEELKKILASYDQVLSKGITTSSITSVPAASASTLTVRQDLDPVIVNIVNRGTPFRDMVARSQGQGAAVVFNTASSLYSAAANPRDMVYADGALPTARTTAYTTKTIPYVSVGYSGSVTGLAQAQGESLLDLYSAEVEKGTRAVIQGEEWLDFWGSSATTANTAGLYQYAGLDELISTNTVDALGGPISKTLINKAVRLIAQYGGMATHIFASINTAQNINELFNQYSQVIINGNDRQNLILGNLVKKISTVVGELEVVGDFFINPGNTYPLKNGASSTPSGATTSTVFILAMPYIEMRDLKKIGMEELGRVADYRSFYVNEYTALKNTAEKWCAKIENVAEAAI